MFCIVCVFSVRCTCSTCRGNLVFVVGDCPHSSEDLAAFFSHQAELPSAQLKGRGRNVKDTFLSDDLSAQLKKCSMALHWVDTAPAQGKTQVAADAVLVLWKEIGVTILLGHVTQAWFTSKRFAPCPH